MSELIYVLITLWGTFLIWDGIQEIRTKKYRTFHRASFFKRATRITIERPSVIIVGVWHLLAGIILLASSVDSLANELEPVNFLIRSIFIYGIIEIVVYFAAFGLKERDESGQTVSSDE